MLAVNPIEAQAAALLAVRMVKARRAEKVAAPSSPLQWATENAVIITPGQGVERFEPHAYQAALLEDTSPRRLVLKARQTGLSTTIALEALYYALHREHDRTLLVSRNQELAGLLIQYVQVAVAGLNPPIKLVAESQSKLVFANGSEIVSLPANPATGRGYPASRVYLDEAAFIEYADLIMQGIAPTLSAGGQMTVQSTPKGRNNLFFRLWSGLEGGEWSRHCIRWDDCPRYDADWEARTRASMTVQAFAEEFGCDFQHSGDSVFAPEDLAVATVGWNGDPAGCWRYITGWDIGRRRDHTVGITLGARLAPDGIGPEVWHEVAFERFLAPYPVIQKAIEDRARIFGTPYVESNGVGDPVIENVLVPVEPWLSTVRTKTQAIQALQLMLQQKTLKLGNEQLLRELSLYSWADDKLIQDAVIATAIAAVHASQPYDPPLPLMAGSVRGWTP